MKGFLLSVVIYILILSNSTNSQIKFEHISTNNLYDINFIKSDLGFIVGEKGTILFSNDSGNTWINKDSITTITLRSIKFVNDSIGYIVGGDYNQNSSEYEGIILRTSDAGNSWMVLQNTLYESLSSILFINDSVGFIVGMARYPGFEYKGLIKKTVDGGMNWTNIESNTYSPLYEIQFLNNEVGYIVGNSISLKTTNSGSNWSDQTAGPSYYWPDLRTLHFIDVNNGFEFGAAIIKTIDGGANWTFIGDAFSLPRILSVNYLNSLEVIAVGENGLFKFSSDGGINLDQISLGITNDLTSVSIRERNKGFAVGSVGILLSFNIDSLYLINGIDNNNSSVNNFELYQNFPNPFNPTTKIKFSILNSANVKIKIYDILGKEVKTLVNDFKNTGTYEIEFDGGNLASGVYFYKFTTGDYSEVRKMVLLR